MSEQESAAKTKPCSLCFNSIEARATKCPHCQSYLGVMRFAALSAVIGLGLLLFVALIWALLMEFGIHRELFSDSPDDVNHAGQVTIQSSEMFLRPKADYRGNEGKAISVVARQRNDSHEVLGSVRLRVEVEKEDSVLVDSFGGSVYGPLNPGDSASFRVDSDNRIHLPEADYKKHTIIVRQATAD